MSDAASALPSARALLREGDYLKFWASRWMGSLGSQIQSVTMGWQIYAISRHTLSVGASAFNVSLVGLITFAPLFFLALPAGETADRHDRRGVLMVCYAGEIATVGVLSWAAFTGAATIPLLLGTALAFGVDRRAGDRRGAGRHLSRRGLHRDAGALHRGRPGASFHPPLDETAGP